MAEGRRRAPLLWLLGSLALAAIVVVGFADDEGEDERSARPRGQVRGLTQAVEHLCVAVGRRSEGQDGADSPGPGGRAHTASELARGVRRLGLLDDGWAVRVKGLVDGLTAYEEASRLAQAGDVLADPVPVAREIASSRRALDAAAARLGAPSCAASSSAFGGPRAR